MCIVAILANLCIVSYMVDHYNLNHNCCHLLYRYVAFVLVIGFYKWIVIVQSTRARTYILTFRDAYMP